MYTQILIRALLGLCVQDPVIISKTCDYNATLYYKVIVEDSEANVVISEEVICDGLCQITLNTISIVDFNITVIAVNAVGQSENVTYEILISKFPNINMCKVNITLKSLSLCSNQGSVCT